MGVGFLHGFTLGIILLGDMMKKFWDLHKQILQAEEFPCYLRTVMNPNKIAPTLRHFIIKNKLPLNLKIKGEMLILNKKADADTPA